ncbi:hypothetical protein LguiB_026375 [Lonicera macranthoides]
MGKKEQQQQEELLKFFSIRGTDDSLEWYADWPQLRHPFLSHLSTDEEAEALLLRRSWRNVRLRPGMRWRVMDMTSMQFLDTAGMNRSVFRKLRQDKGLAKQFQCKLIDSAVLAQFVDGTFDAVVDKGGLDALMEPELGPKLGSQYLSEAKRVLKSGGKFICLTLAEAHFLGLLFPKFCDGWIVSLHAIPQKPSKKPNLETFMVVAKKDSSIVMHQVSSSFTRSTIDCSGDQARGLFEALDIENRIRTEHASGSDLLYSLEDLQLGAGGDLTELSPGRRLLLTLGEPGSSWFFNKAVLLDALQQSSSFLYSCGVFLVPKVIVHLHRIGLMSGSSLLKKANEQSLKAQRRAARLIMVLLDTSHSNASMDDIQKDLSPLVKHLAPGKNGSGAQIPFMVAGDGIKQRKVVHQIQNLLTRPFQFEFMLTGCLILSDFIVY